MSVDSTSDDEQPEVDDEAVSEVVRKPTRAAGDLSEGGEASGAITLEELLRRVQRIEEHLGITSTGSYETPIAKEINDLKESVRRIEHNIRSSPAPGDIESPPVVPIEGRKSKPLSKARPPLLKQPPTSAGET